MKVSPHTKIATIKSVGSCMLNALVQSGKTFSDLAVYNMSGAKEGFSTVKERIKIGINFDDIDKGLFTSYSRDSLSFGLEYDFSEFSVSYNVGIPQRMYKSLPRFMANAFLPFITEKHQAAFLKRAKSIRTLSAEGLARLLNDYVPKLGNTVQYSCDGAAIITIKCYIDAKAAYPEYNTPDLYDLRLRGNIFTHRVLKFLDAILASMILVSDSDIKELHLINADNTSEVDILCHATEHDDETDEVIQYSDAYMTPLVIAEAVFEFCDYFISKADMFMSAEFGVIVRLFLAGEYFNFHDFLLEEDEEEGATFSVDLKSSDICSVVVVTDDTNRQVRCVFSE